MDLAQRSQSVRESVWAALLKPWRLAEVQCICTACGLCKGAHVNCGKIGYEFDEPNEEEDDEIMLDFEWLRAGLSAKIFLEHEALKGLRPKSTGSEIVPLEAPSPKKKRAVVKSPPKRSPGSAVVVVGKEERAYIAPVRAAEELLIAMHDFEKGSQTIFEVLQCALVKNVDELRSITDVHWTPERTEVLAAVSDQVFGLR